MRNFREETKTLQLNFNQRILYLILFKQIIK